MTGSDYHRLLRRVREEAAAATYLELLAADVGPSV
jgi:hypothetical protein